MPWTPTDAKKKYKKLTSKQAEVWSKVANSALESGDDEATAIKKANAAVSRMGRQEAQTEAATLMYEVGRMISSSNMSKLKTAIGSMKTAIESIEPLIADNAEESVVNSEDVLDESITQRWELANISEAAKILAQDDSYDATRMAVSHALRKRALSDAMAQKVAAGSTLGYDDYYYSYGSTPYIQDLYDAYVVYRQDSKLYQCEYTVSDSTVTLGDPTEVQVSYVPITTTTTNNEEKGVVVEGDLITLEEKAVKDDGTVRIKLISPGWGSSGYYSKEMLKRDGSKVFKAGTHMYMNHPTESESRERPERDVRDLVGSLLTDAQWENASANNTGEGLYANARVYDQYRSFVNEAAQDIGVSIRASGTATEGEAEKRHGMIVNGLHEAFSVDYVTFPGRGGQVLSLFESARDKHKVEVTETPTETVKDTNVVDITEAQLKELQEAAERGKTLEAQLEESNRNLARLNEAMTLSRARDIVSSIVSTADTNDLTKARLMKECVRVLPMKDGALDEETFRTNTETAVKEELTYLESVGSISTGGRVTNMGVTTPTEMSEADIDKELNSVFGDLGVKSESGRNIAVRGRN